MTTVFQLETMIAKAVPIVRKNGFRLDTGLFLHGSCCCPLTAIVVARRGLKPTSRLLRQIQGTVYSAVVVATKLSDAESSAFIDGVDSPSRTVMSRLSAELVPFFKLGRMWRQRIFRARAQRQARAERKQGL